MTAEPKTFGTADLSYTHLLRCDDSTGCVTSSVFCSNRVTRGVSVATALTATTVGKPYDEHAKIYDL